LNAVVLSFSLSYHAGQAYGDIERRPGVIYDLFERREISTQKAAKSSRTAALFLTSIHSNSSSSSTSRMIQALSLIFLRFSHNKIEINDTLDAGRWMRWEIKRRVVRFFIFRGVEVEWPCHPSHASMAA